MEELIIIKANENTIYTVLEKKINNQYVIERSRLPFVKVLYNLQTRKGKLYSFFSGTITDASGHKRPISKQDVDAAVKETIAWAKENITT